MKQQFGCIGGSQPQLISGSFQPKNRGDFFYDEGRDSLLTRAPLSDQAIKDSKGVVLAAGDKELATINQVTIGLPFCWVCDCAASEPARRLWSARSSLSCFPFAAKANAFRLRLSLPNLRMAFTDERYLQTHKTTPREAQALNVFERESCRR